MPEQILTFKPNEVAKLLQEGKMAVVNVSSVAEPPKLEQSGFERAREILGKDFLGLDAIHNMESKLKGIGIDIKFYPEFEKDELPPLPYTEDDLRLAKENGEMLVLRPKTMGENEARTDITISEFRKLFEQDPLDQGTHAIYPNTWYKDEDFATKPAEMHSSWALVKKEILDESTNKTFENQEDILRKYGEDLKNKGAANVDIKRRTAFEAMWDTMLYYANTEEKLLPNVYDWTQTRASDGNFVNVGVCDSDGLYVGRWSPGDARPDIGVCPTR